jgi:hypothetical protein
MKTSAKRQTGWPQTLVAIVVVLAIFALFRLADIYEYLPDLSDW